MTPGKLLVELFRRGVRVEADGDRLRYSPPSKMTPELVELLRQHKAALLETLGRTLFPATTKTSSADPTPVYVYETLAAPRENGSSVDVDSVDVAATGWLDGSDELPDLDPCPICGSLELWQVATWPYPWRCSTCDPPTTALRLLEHLGRPPRIHRYFRGVSRSVPHNHRPQTTYSPAQAPPASSSPAERSPGGSSIESPTATGP